MFEDEFAPFGSEEEFAIWSDNFKDAFHDYKVDISMSTSPTYVSLRITIIGKRNPVSPKINYVSTRPLERDIIWKKCQDMSIQELRELAEERGIEYRRFDTKSELCKRLNDRLLFLPE